MIFEILLFTVAGDKSIGAHEYNCISSKVEKSEDVISKDTAIGIAESAIDHATGSTSKEDKPFLAKLSGNNWIVKGTHPDGATGGPVIVIIDAYTGCVLNLELHE